MRQEMTLRQWLQGRVQTFILDAAKRVEANAPSAERQLAASHTFGHLKMEASANRDGHFTMIATLGDSSAVFDCGTAWVRQMQADSLAEYVGKLLVDRLVKQIETTGDRA